MEERQLIQVQYANGLSQEVLYPSGFLAIIYFAVTLRAAVVLFQVKRLHAMRSMHAVVGACHRTIATGRITRSFGVLDERVLR